MFAGTSDMHLTIDHVPTAFWFSLPPGLAIGTFPHLSESRQKIFCVLISLGAYSVASFVFISFQSPSAWYAVKVWWALFTQNNVIPFYAVVFTSGFADGLCKKILVLAKSLLRFELFMLKPLGQARRNTGRQRTTSH
jgi:hypothetical protein